MRWLLVKAYDAGNEETVVQKILRVRNLKPGLVVNPNSLISEDPGKIITFHIIGDCNTFTTADLSTLSISASYSGGGSWDTTYIPGSLEKKHYVANLPIKIPNFSNSGDSITIDFTLLDILDYDSIVRRIIHTK